MFKKIFEENEALNSLRDNVKEKTSNSFYGWFLLFSLIFGWEFFYTMFFVSEDKIWEETKKLKNVYLREEFIRINWESFLFHLVLPFLLACFFVWVFPRFLILVRKEQEKNRRLNREAELDEYKKLLENKGEVLDKEKNVKEKEIEKEKKGREVEIARRGNWEEEYENFRKSVFFEKLPLVIEIIYRHGGFLFSDFEERISFDALSFFDVNEITRRVGKDEIEFTDKGKFFVRKFQLDEQRRQNEEMSRSVAIPF